MAADLLDSYFQKTELPHISDGGRWGRRNRRPQFVPYAY